MDGPGHIGSTLGAARIFDRQSARRGDREYLLRLKQQATSRYMLLFDLKPVMKSQLGTDPVEIDWLSPESVAALGIDVRPASFLGCDPLGQAHFSVALEAFSLPAPVVAGGLPERAVDLRALAVDGRITPDELSVAGEARALAEWHRSHRCCSRCGAHTQVTDGGWRRHCLACLRDHFPRTDPVVIMLVTNGDACLLARSPRFPGRLISALAGFLEPGEDIEHAVAREVKEEVGLDVTSVRYLSSQPWPFPHSLMIGCLAAASGRDLILEPTEISEAVWADRAMIRAINAGEHPDGYTLPGKFAIARSLVRHWYDHGG